VPPAPVAETAATLKTSEGVSVSYTNMGGQITVTSGTGATVPISDTKLCIFNGGSNRTFPANWTCETIEFATDQCDIKTTGGDPCRFIGGTCILYRKQFEWTIKRGWVQKLCLFCFLQKAT